MSTEKETVQAAGGPSRREILRKSLSLGAVGYVAPMIVGSVTSVSAQSLSGSAFCPTADTCSTFSCPGGCACVPTVEGPTVCIVPTCVAPCTTTADCPSGSVCFTLGCCGPATYCVPIATSGTTCLTGAPTLGPSGPWPPAA
jgi:hypothetical protein